MNGWGIFGYLDGQPLPIVLGESRQVCLRKLKEALAATPHPADRIVPLHYRQFDESAGCWRYRGDVAFHEFFVRLRPGANGRH